MPVRERASVQRLLEKVELRQDLVVSRIIVCLLSERTQQSHREA